MSALLLSLFLNSLLILPTQPINKSPQATVHVYRQGRLLVGVPVLVDGKAIVSLTPHTSATVQVPAGEHELSFLAGEPRPVAQFTAAAGGEYFFEVEYEHVTSPSAMRVLKVGLNMRSGFTDAAGLHEMPLDAARRP